MFFVMSSGSEIRERNLDQDCCKSHPKIPWKRLCPPRYHHVTFTLVHGIKQS